MTLEFGTWYQVNCEAETEWYDDFALIRDSGFDFVVLWNQITDPGGTGVGGDCRPTADDSGKVFRALAEVGKVGLVAYLGIWHPYNMGDIPAGYRLQWANGETINAPNIYNREWLSKEWQPYVRTIAQRYAGHEAYRGVYLDDTFPSVPQYGTSPLGYSPADKERFCEWLQRRYLTVGNLNCKYKLREPGQQFGSFAQISPPPSPEVNLALWADWMEARAGWCEDFARTAQEAYRAVDPDPHHLLVLSDQDYHLRCTHHQYGVDYQRLMRHLDRFEIYMADDHRQVDKRALLANVRYNVERGIELAAGKPFQFHTWFADPVAFTPMDPGVLEAMIGCAAEYDVRAIEVYTFKAHDWRVPRGRQVNERPCFKQVSLKYNPAILRQVTRAIAKLK